MITYREYPDHAAYVAHQASKLNPRSALALSQGSYINAFTREFTAIASFVKPVAQWGGAALCLGARRGSEVLALRQLGIEHAWGVDVQPGPRAAGSFAVPGLVGVVIPGDFMNLPFLDGVFRLLYTNSVDHVISLSGFAAECARVAASAAVFIIRLAKVNPPMGRWEACAWDDWSEVITRLCKTSWSFVTAQPTASPRRRTGCMEVVLKRA